MILKLGRATGAKDKFRKSLSLTGSVFQQQLRAISEQSCDPRSEFIIIVF